MYTFSLFRFLGGLLLTMNIATGFGSGFLIASYREDRNLNFVQMIKALFRPLLMILGEKESQILANLIKWIRSIVPYNTMMICYFMPEKEKEALYYLTFLILCHHTVILSFSSSFPGEFEFNSLFDTHEDTTSLFYASFLLLSIAIIGSLVLVNLILALILSDVSHLYALCHSKEVFRRANQV